MAIKILKKDDLACVELLEKAHLNDSTLWELYKKGLSVGFINDALSSAAFIDYPFGSARKAEFRVYIAQSRMNPSQYFVEEYIIITFHGGAWAAKRAGANSNAANFRAIGDLLNGGYYDVNDEVESLEKTAYRLILKRGGDLEIRVPENHDHKEGE